MAAPSWSLTSSVVALQKVAQAAVSGTVNVQNCFGCYLYLRAMRLATTTPTAGIIIKARRVLRGTPAGGAGTVDIPHPGALFIAQDNTTASNLTTLNGSPTIPGTTVTLTTATGFAANQMCGIVDSTSSPAAVEFALTSRLNGTSLIFDRNLTNTGILTGATITNGALVYPPVWVEGSPSTTGIEVIFDNGQEATLTYAVQAYAEVLGSIG